MKARTALVSLVLLTLLAGLVLWTRSGCEAALAVEAREARAPATPPVPEPVEPVPAATHGAAAPVEAASTRAVLEVEPAGDLETAEVPEPEPGDAHLDVEVVAQETGEPLAGVRLMVVAEERRHRWTSHHVDRHVARLGESPESDDEGRATFFLPAQATYVLYTLSWREPHVEEVFRELEAPAAGTHMSVRIEVRTRPDLVFFGRVVDAETQAPLAGASVDVLRFERLVGETSCDPGGLFRVIVPSWDRIALRIEQDGYAWTALEPSRGHEDASSAAIVPLSNAACLLVHVSDARGNPVGGLDVRITTTQPSRLWQGPASGWGSFEDPLWRASTDASGSALLDELPPEVPLTVDLFRENERIHRRGRSLSLEPGEERPLMMQLGAGCRLAGRAVEADGRPSMDVKVWLMQAPWPEEARRFQSYERSEVVAHVVTDGEGRFTFDDVTPGWWHVGPEPGEDPDSPAPIARQVRIEEGETSKELVLQVHRGLFIRGTVLDPAGEPAARAFVHDPYGAQSTCDDAGSFALGPLEPGECELSAVDFERPLLASSEPVWALAGDDGVVLRLRPGGSIAGSVLGPEGPPDTAEVWLLDTGEPGSAWISSVRGDDPFRFPGLLPGVYTLRATDAAGHVGVLPDVIVDSGRETAGLEIRLVAGDVGE